MKRTILGVFVSLLAISLVFGSQANSVKASSTYPSGSLVNDGGTIYFISGTTKVPFTNWQSFVGLGYSLNQVTNGDTSGYTASSSYMISTANAAHPWGSWVSHNGTVYYSTQSGLVGVPTPAIFTANGGQWKFVVPANQYDLNTIAPSSTLANNDSRVYSPTNPNPIKACPAWGCSGPEPVQPTPIPTPIAQTTTFTIPFWGVQFQIPSGLSDLQYANIDITPDVLPFSTQSLINLDQSTGGSYCAASQAPLGAISRSSSSVTGPATLIGVIDHYYYYYGGPQATCSNNTQVQSLQSTQKTELANAITSLVALTSSTPSTTAPTISTVTPSSGPAGTQITITGTGFLALKLYDPGSNPDQSTDGIFLTNGTVWSDQASPTTTNIQSDNTITATLNTGACQGPTDICSSNFSSVLMPGNYLLYVVTANGTSNKINFTVKVADVTSNPISESLNNTLTSPINVYPGVTN
jgi:hypothetical protein